jgi:hypothetical protein
MIHVLGSAACSSSDTFAVDTGAQDRLYDMTKRCADLKDIFRETAVQHCRFLSDGAFGTVQEKEEDYDTADEEALDADGVAVAICAGAVEPVADAVEPVADTVEPLGLSTDDDPLVAVGGWKSIENLSDDTVRRLQEHDESESRVRAFITSSHTPSEFKAVFERRVHEFADARKALIENAVLLGTFNPDATEDDTLQQAVSELDSAANTPIEFTQDIEIASEPDEPVHESVEVTKHSDVSCPAPSRPPAILHAKYRLLGALAREMLGGEMPASVSMDTAAVELLNADGDMWVDFSLVNGLEEATSEVYKGWAMPKHPFTGTCAGVSETILDAAVEALSRARSSAVGSADCQVKYSVEATVLDGEHVRLSVSATKATTSGGVESSTEAASVDADAEESEFEDDGSDGVLESFSDFECDDVSVSSAALAAFRGSRYDPGHVRAPTTRTGAPIRARPLR